MNEFSLDDEATQITQMPAAMLEALQAATPATAVPEPPAPPAITRASQHQIPQQLAPTDRVPAFRRGLKLRRQPDGSCDVFDPETQAGLSLNKYESSLARMFDGRRQLAEVLDAGQRLGIPVNLESLRTFIQHLENHQLFDLSRPTAAADNGVFAADAPDAAATAWTTRGQWEQSVRALFQTGIRLLRTGKHEAAASYFEALLEQDPANEEAKELLAMARQMVSTTPAHDVLRPSYVAMEPAYSQAGPQPPHATLPPTYQPVGAPPHQRRSRIGLVIGLTATVIVLATVVTWKVITRDRAHAVLASPLVAATELKREPIRPDRAAPVTPNSTKSADHKPEPVKPEPVKPEKKPPHPAASPGTPVTSPVAGRVSSSLRGSRAVTKGETLFKIVRFTGDPAKFKAAAEKVEKLTELAKQDPATYEPFVAEAKQKLVAAGGMVSTIVAAPKAGRARPIVKDGATVAAGQILAQLE
ncbi:hypothetical protein BH11MYX1_BH11MYX1_01370 [soil metagenome]